MLVFIIIIYNNIEPLLISERKSKDKNEDMIYLVPELIFITRIEMKQEVEEDKILWKIIKLIQAKEC